ncbi:MAG: hypothetical protein IT210_09560 [Armatimonadetes bacterium]|nr:hypothetical protein [Armatimonadota bacterium]
MPSYRQLHSWGLSPEEAVAIQSRLKAMVVTVPLDVAAVRIVAGMDIFTTRGRKQFLRGWWR